MHIHMYIYIYIFTWRSRSGEHFCLNVSDHHVKSDTEQCCNNWRICFLYDPMEQIGLIFDKIKFHTCPDDIFKCIFLNENVWISIEISLKFVPKGQINNNPALVQIMAWRRPGNKPLSETVMVSLLTHLCVTRPQWVKTHNTLMRSDYTE